ncbi:MAG: hypothetical protein WBE21_11745 [Candidatus Acidiferrales bacterium]|jgi:hypothetical protein
MLQGDSQLAVKMFQPANLGTNIAHFLLQAVANRRAGSAAIPAEGKQFANLREREPEPLRPPHKEHSFDVLIRVKSESAFRAPRPSQDLISFVETNRIHA